MKLLRSFIVIIMLTACTASAFGSTVMGVTVKSESQRFRWKERAIKIVVSTSLTKSNANIKDDSDVVGAIRRSLQAWQDVANIEFQIETSDKQSVSPSGVSGDGVSLITIGSTPENILFFAKDAQSVSAKTRVFYNRKGFITEADIVLNPFQQFSTDGTYGTFDLQSAVTHEVGHLLGLRHSGVLGSAMSENMAKNSTLSAGEFAPRPLSDSDISSIRELYGADNETEDCCTAITGKLTLPFGKPGKNLKVWAEESETGRVVAQADTSSDGSFRIGGLPNADYKVFWKTKSGSTVTSSGELGFVEIGNGESKPINQKITLDPTKFVLDYVGVNGQLADSAVRIEGGREETVYIGGKDLNSKNLNIEFGSPFLHIVPASITDQDFGAGIAVIRFIVAADANTPRGVYTIFASSNGSSKASLIGALRVE